MSTVFITAATVLTLVGLGLYGLVRYLLVGIRHTAIFAINVTSDPAIKTPSHAFVFVTLFWPLCVWLESHQELVQRYLVRVVYPLANILRDEHAETTAGIVDFVNDLDARLFGDEDDDV